MNVKPETPPAVERPASAQIEVERWRDGRLERTQDAIAEEAPIAISYQGVPYVVMMATPQHLEELALGFTLSEGLVATADEIHSVEAVAERDSLEVRIGIAPARFSEILRNRRNLTGRTGCGVCGAETIDQVIRRPPAVSAPFKLPSSELHAALLALNDGQMLNARTGATHAAAWGLPGRGIQIIREDVGRHNALDKVIGALMRRHIDPATGYLLVTSRASYELVQKSATVGISMLAAVSAPTALAIRLALETGMTLIGFARAHQHVVYAHAGRLELDQ